MWQVGGMSTRGMTKNPLHPVNGLLTHFSLILLLYIFNSRRLQGNIKLTHYTHKYIMPFSCTQMAKPWQKINQFKKVKQVMKNIAYEGCSSKVVSNRIFATRLTFTLGSRNKKRGLTFSLYCFTRIMIKPYSVDPLFACCASSVFFLVAHEKKSMLSWLAWRKLAYTFALQLPTQQPVYYVVKIR